MVAERLDELVAGATDRVEVRTSDAKSGARFERLVIDGERHFLKVALGRRRLDHAGHRQHLELGVQGLAGRALPRDPAVIDHTVVGMALEGPVRPRGSRC